MQVRDVMSKQVIFVSPGESVAVAARLLSRYNVGSLPVCGADGRLQGIVTDRDITLRCVAAGEDAGQLPVSAVMTRRVVTARPEEPAQMAADRMAHEQVRRLPVTQQGCLVGMLSLADFAAREDQAMEVAEALCDICSNVLNR